MKITGFFMFFYKKDVYIDCNTIILTKKYKNTKIKKITNTTGIKNETNIALLINCFWCFIPFMF